MSADDVKASPVHMVVTRRTSQTLSHRWGHELRDHTDYTVSRQGDRLYVQGRNVDLSLPLLLATDLAHSILSVIEAYEEDGR